MRRLHDIGCDVLGARGTLGPRGYGRKGGELLGASPVGWDNSLHYDAGVVVYNDGKYYRALRDIDPPFLPSLMSGEVPGKSDAWREIGEAQAYAPPPTSVFGVSSIGDWDSKAAYAVGDVVRYWGSYYRCVSPVDAALIFGNTTPDSSDAWVAVSSAQLMHDNVFGARTKQTRWRQIGGTSSAPTLVGVSIDVDGLAARFDSLPQTNQMVHTIWVGHGLPLAQRVVADAQKMLNEAIVPTSEFSFHGQVMDMSKAANALDDKIQKLSYDDTACPFWDDVKNFFVNASKLANLLEGTIDQTVKWSDVKSAAQEAAHGASKALDNATSTAKWTTGLLVGGAVVLGLGVLYAGYKIVASPTGGAIVGGYLGVRRP